MENSIMRGAAPLRAWVAETAADMQAVARLRYEVYIEEQGKPYPSADHANRTWTDALDLANPSVILVAAGDLVVGTIRVNALDDPEVRAVYGPVFDLTGAGAPFAEDAVVCSRLAVAPRHRNGRARALLLQTIFEHGLAGGAKHCFAASAAPLLRLFRSYGFREYAGPVQDPVVGKLRRSVLKLHDLRHLEAVGSPFVPSAKRLLSIADAHEPCPTEHHRRLGRVLPEVNLLVRGGYANA
ncbi:GNAT family N-acetyltransferase [Ramlibacter sp. AN1133]|uniref:GNAT family N-acetyltransferase n=1 Tax=Ramlibacter sp. AN1133 TaxID=3133429 RepID=UPI0030BAD6CE